MKSGSVFVLAILLSLIFPTLQASAQVPPAEIEIIFDASRSMNDPNGPVTRLAAAKQALVTLVGQITPGARVGLRVFGDTPVRGNVSESCGDSKLVLPIQAVNPAAMVASVNGLNAYGTTPIAYSLELGAADFTPDAAVQKTIILISDGEESCGRNPEQVIQMLKEKGIAFTLHTIGFDVDPAAAGQLRKLSEMTGGTYADAKNADELTLGLQQVAEKSMLLQVQRGGGDNLLSAASGARIITSSTQTFARLIDGKEEETEVIWAGQEAVFAFKDHQGVLLKKFAVPIFAVNQYNPSKFTLLGSLDSPEKGFFPIAEINVENKVYFGNVYQEFEINPPAPVLYLKVVVGTTAAGGTQTYHSEWKAYGDFLSPEALAEAQLAQSKKDYNVLGAEYGGQLIAASNMNFQYAIDGVGTQAGKAMRVEGFPQEAIFGFKDNAGVELKKIAIPIYQAQQNNCKTFEFYASTTTPTGEYTKIGAFETMNMVFAGNPFQEYTLEAPVQAKYLKVKVVDTHGLYYCDLAEIQAVGSAV